jgi:zinc transporter ZupT
VSRPQPAPEAAPRPRPAQEAAHRAPAEHSGVYRAAARRKPGLAVTALVFAFLVPPLGIILGHVARRRSRRGIAATALFFAYLLTLAAAAVVVLRVRGVAPFDRNI